MELRPVVMPHIYKKEVICLDRMASFVFVRFRIAIAKG